MSSVTRRALRVYAALNELKGNDNDVLDALIPFFEPILTLMNGTIFDPHVFQQAYASSIVGFLIAPARVEFRDARNCNY